MNYDSLPRVDCILDVLGKAQDHDIPMMSWNFAYFHGKLAAQFDELKVGPGDLIQCSIDQYDFPVGMSVVMVNGSPSVAYIWEEDEVSMFRDLCGSIYYRKPRRGLILYAHDSDSEHAYALTCMEERRKYL